MTISTAIEEAIAELDLYADTAEATDARVLAQLLLADLGDFHRSTASSGDNH